MYEKELKKINGNLEEIGNKLVGIEHFLQEISEEGVLGRGVTDAIIAIGRAQSKELDNKYKMFEQDEGKELPHYELQGHKVRSLINGQGTTK